MNDLWSYFWPCLAAGLLVGGPAGTIAFRRRARRNTALALGLSIVLAVTAVWHGPLGAAERFSGQVEHNARAVLDHYELTKVAAHLHHRPLTRRLTLAGPAAAFQTTELVRLMSPMPRVSIAH